VRKRDSADRLVKRIRKIERAQDRLSDIKARILTQSDALAELLETAHGLVSDNGAAKSAGQARRATAAKRSTAPKRVSRKAPPAPRATRPL
jgi:hypothetical protein